MLCCSRRLVNAAWPPLQVTLGVFAVGTGPKDLKGWSRPSRSCITHLLSYPMHHDCPTQPCFHTLTMRVKACTHGCLWATSVTSLSTHTLGLQWKAVVKILNVSKCSALFFHRWTHGRREFMSTAGNGACKDRQGELEGFQLWPNLKPVRGITCVQVQGCSHCLV